MDYGLQFVTALKEANEKLDVAIANLSEDSLKDLEIQVQICNDIFNCLPPAEQSTVSNFWVSGVVAVLSSIRMYDAMPAIKFTMATSILPVLKTNILNTLNGFSISEEITTCNISKESTLTDTPVEPTQTVTETVSTPSPKSANSGKVSNSLKIFAIAILCCSLAVFVTTLIITLTVGHIGNIVMLISGLIELGLGFLVFKYFDWKTKYTCPECGTKRIHHRTYVTTQERIKTYGTELLTKFYTHIYNDTYVCPKCGETMYCNGIKKSGGTYEVNSSGAVDKYIAPKEF